MSVLAIINLDGEPDTLLQKYDQSDEATRDLPTTGRRSRVVARSTTGIVITDVWESEEHLNAFMGQPKFQSELQRAGMPDPRVELYQVDRQQ